MGKKKRRKVVQAAYSIGDFCQAHGIGEWLYYQLKRRGDGPDVMRVGGRTLISHEAAARWRRKRELAHD